MQSDHQIKYDGSWAWRNHVFRFGAGFNRILGGGFAEFLGLAPAVGSPSTAIRQCFGASNPELSVTNVSWATAGVLFENPSFGFPGGWVDHRFSWYVGDSWKVKPNFTLTLGLRYVRDTGRTDSDLGPIPALDQFNNQFYSGLGDRVAQPNQNFAPQLGFAWDPKSNGKTVIRGGIGLFYENSIWNNNLFDRPARLEQGLFLGSQSVCSNGGPVTYTLPGTTTTVNPGSTGPGALNICNQPIGSVATQIVQLQQQYQAATLAAGPAANGSFIGNTLTDGIDITGTQMFAPQYVSPRSVQMNIGIQHEIRHGTVVTADYLRNVSTHNLLAVDTNHIGDSRFFNLANAQAAITTTNQTSVVPTWIVLSRTGPGLETTRRTGLIPDIPSVVEGRARPSISRDSRTPGQLFRGSIRTLAPTRCCFRLGVRFTTVCKLPYARMCRIRCPGSEPSICKFRMRSPATFRPRGTTTSSTSLPTMRIPLNTSAPTDWTAPSSSPSEARWTFRPASA